MHKLVLLYCVILSGLVFMAVPDQTEPIDWFPLYDGIKLTAQFYFYYLFEHIGIIILCYIIASEARQYKREVYIFFYLQVLQLLDFIITYNTTWFHVGTIPISMNIISVAIFGLAILNRHESGLRL